MHTCTYLPRERKPHGLVVLQKWLGLSSGQGYGCLLATWTKRRFTWMQPARSHSLGMDSLVTPATHGGGRPQSMT